MPYLVPLARNGFSSAHLCATHLMMRLRSHRKTIEKDLLTALLPLVSSDSIGDRNIGILVLSSFPLSIESANMLSRVLFSQRHRSTDQATALFIASKGNDPEILVEMRMHPNKVMKYISAMITEEWIRRDSPLYDHRQLVSPIALPESEIARVKRVDQQLALLAQDAIPEALEDLRKDYLDPDPYVIYLNISTLQYLSKHALLPTDDVLRSLDIVLERVSSIALRRIIMRYQNVLSTNYNYVVP